MLFAAKHFDPQLGIDVHTHLAPPGPWPTPHIGFIFDPFDLLPTVDMPTDSPVFAALQGFGTGMNAVTDFLGVSTSAPKDEAAEGEAAPLPATVPVPLGATIKVQGVFRAIASCIGVDFHIPLGVPTPFYKMFAGMHFTDELFMGSKIVLADGEPFSHLGHPVLSCSFVGMLPPPRVKAKPKVPPTLHLPTTFNLAIPPRVYIGGPPTISWTALIMKVGLKVLGKGFKKLRQIAFKKMDPGFLKCKVLRAEPVDIRDGSVSVEHQDFEIPGRLPLAWTRKYSSTAIDEVGVVGHGWSTPADIQLQVLANGAAQLSDGGPTALFRSLPAAGSDAVEFDFFDGARLQWLQRGISAQLSVRVKGGVRYVFDAQPFEKANALYGEAVEDDAIVARFRLSCIEDLCNNRWSFVWGPEGLVRIVESGIEGYEGRTIVVDSASGHVTAMKLRDPEGGAEHPLVGYRYAQRDLVAALDPLNAARTFLYTEHRMVQHTDRVGLSFYYDYNAQWQVVHAWGDGGLHDYRFVYDELLKQTEVTNSLGYLSLIKFDDQGLPICEVDPLGGATIFEYDEAGRTVAVAGPEGLRTEFVYDERGNVLSVRRPDESTIRSEYDDKDQLTATVDPLGHRWSQAIDARGLPLSQTDPLGAVTRFEHDARGQLLRHINARGAVTELQYDRHGQLRMLTDPLGHSKHFEHDVLGRLQCQANALGQGTRCRYDGKGRLLSILQPDGSQISCIYDPEDQLLRYVDEAGAQTRLEYVGIGQIGKRIQPDGHTVEYRYDTEEQLVAVVNQRREEYQLKRDALGRIVEEVDYWGQSRHYDYDAAGRLTSTVDPLGQRIGFASDKMGRIVAKTLADVLHPRQQIQEHFSYDKAGQLVGLRNPARTATRRFDAVGQLQEEVQDGFRVGYGYDATGNRTLRETSAGNCVRFDYDLRDQVAGVTINHEAPIAIARDALGRATGERLSAQVTRNFQYNARSLLTAQTVLKDAAPLFDTAYDYDETGNLITRRDSGQGINHYRYDPIGRLLEHTDPKGRVERFIHDPAGDRLRTTVKEARAREVAGGEEQAVAEWTREGEYQGVHYVFDRAGDLVRKGRESGGKSRGDHEGDDLKLIWDANHRLAESCKGGQSTRYGYDPLGRRVFKRNPTHTTYFFWDGDALLGEVTEANDMFGIATVRTGNLIEAQRRRHKLEALYTDTREYVYYPDSFVPLALIDNQQEQIAVSDTSFESTAVEIAEWKNIIEVSLASPSTQKSSASANSTPAPIYLKLRSVVYHYHVDPNGCPTRITDTAGRAVWSASHAAWGCITESALNNPVFNRK